MSSGDGVVSTREARLERALVSRGGQVLHATDAGHAHELVRKLVDGRPVCADDDPVLTDVLDGMDRVDDAWSAEVGVTTVLCAAADTSTLALPFDVDHRRSTALVPPLHVAVVPVDRLRDTYAEVLTELMAVSPAPSGMRLVSGPSSSGDIEQIHIRGMHGPIELVVVLVGSALAGEDEEAEAREVRMDEDQEPVGRPAPPSSGGPDASPEEQDAQPGSTPSSRRTASAS